MKPVTGWMLALVALLCSSAFGQEVLVFDDGNTGNGIACLMPPPPSPPPFLPACPVPGVHFLVQRKRAELQVFNRKFLTDYSISIDAVTAIQTGPNIRNLNEAENLTLGAASLASIPPSKGGAEGLTARSADSILLDLVNEATAAKPLTDLDNDFAVVERENARITAQILDFDERYNLLLGPPSVPRNPAGCQAARGSPSVRAISICLGREKDVEDGLWPVPGPYVGEQQFRDAKTRVDDLIVAVKALGSKLTDTDLPKKLSTLETAISQYENDVSVFRGNAQAAFDAARLALQVNNDFLRTLRREQVKALLLEKLKGPDSKPVLDEAEMNALLDKYGTSSAANRAFATQRWTTLREDADDYLAQTTVYGGEFSDDLRGKRNDLGVVLLQAIAGLNVAQGELLNRVNEIYDRSEVRDPLPRQIDLSGHPGNLVVYYTIRRIETFQRYTVAQVQGPGSTQQGAQTGTPLPQSQSAGSGAQPSAATGGAANSNGGAATGNASSSGNSQSGGATNQGIVVAKGSFEVHDVFHANVAAAFVFSTLKNESISKVAQPQACSGTSTTPDTNCFAPFLNGNDHVWAPIVGLDYYFRPRDTFPRTAGMPWLCQASPAQCFGVMGAASVTSFNNYFLGGFFEPVLGVQFGVGAHFGTRTVLASGYKFGTPVDITGDFPTHDERATGLFLSAGLDLGIFRKVFGKVTGIGTSATGTSGAK